MAMASRPGSAQDASPEVEANIAVVRRFVDEVVNAQNPEAARGIVSPDYTPPALDRLAPGIDGYIQRMTDATRQIANIFAEYAWVEDEVIGVGNVVAWRGRETGTSKDGRLVEVTSVLWFVLEDGLIVTRYGGSDSGEISDQLYG